MDAVERSIRRIKNMIFGTGQGQWGAPPPWISGFSGPVINLPPPNKNSILYYYIPAHGVLTYSVLAVNVTNPALITRLFPKRDITSYLLMSTITGSFLWLWKRPHLSGTGAGIRFSWVFLGSSMYSLGSVLLWAILRSSLGRRPLLSMFMGLATGFVLTISAIDYFHFLDRDIEVMEQDVSENYSEEEKYNVDI